MALAFNHGGSAIDLTSISTNVDVAPVATPRLGGFTLRNRFAGSLAVTLSGSAGSGSNLANNPIRILEVPKRTLVKNLNVFAVAGETVPDHAWTVASSTIASGDMASAKLLFVAQPIKKIASSTKTYDSLSASLTLGEILLKDPVHGTSTANGSMQGFLKVVSAQSSSTSSATLGGQTIMMAPASSGAVPDAGAYYQPRYFPNGGRIVMTLAGSVADNASTLDDWSGVCSGVWEVQAECEYVPE